MQSGERPVQMSCGESPPGQRAVVTSLHSPSCLREVPGAQLGQVGEWQVRGAGVSSF